jgi:hypothetical protein
LTNAPGEANPEQLKDLSIKTVISSTTESKKAD